MKWINAKQQVTVTLYDEEHEEYPEKTMTVEEMLDAYTTEGCPTMYSSPEQHGRWIYLSGLDAFECSICGRQMVRNIFDYCPWCGAKMDEVDK